MMRTIYLIYESWRKHLIYYLIINIFNEFLVGKGYNVIITNDASVVKDNDILLLIGIYHKELFDNKKIKIIFFCLEPLYTDNYNYLSKYINLKNVVAWIDYTNKNINLIKKINNTKPILQCKLFYSKFCEDHYKNNIKSIIKDKKIDILIYGSISNRRENIIKKLRKLNINVVETRQKFTDIYNFIENSKIVLVVHHYDEDYPVDFPRLMKLISSKTFFIHEEIQDEDKDFDFKHIIFSKYDKLVEKCVKYLKLSQEDRDNHALLCYEYYKNKGFLESFFDEFQNIISNIN